MRAWIEQFVVGLNLCPFVRPLLESPQLRVAVCDDARPLALRRSFLAELDLLQSSSEDEIATTLLVFGRGLRDFHDYLDFLELARDLVQAAGLEELVQLASFHPQYCFEGEPPEAAGNYSNRAPYPVIHLLRESMMTRLLEAYPAPERIPQDNVRTLEEIGAVELQRRWKNL